MIIYSIYKIVNNINGKVYVGLTRKHKKRFRQHIYLSRCKNPQLLIQEKINQYGLDNFSFVLLYQTKDLEWAKFMESHFISEYNCLVPLGYNIHKGGNYCYEFKTSEETRKRMLLDNPGKTKESIMKKTSFIEAQNEFTGECVLVKDRKKFSVERNIPYTSIGWAIQHNKTLKNGWFFKYVKKRTMGV